jgi:hypothetical protein
MAAIIGGVQGNANRHDLARKTKKASRFLMTPSLLNLW